MFKIMLKDFGNFSISFGFAFVASLLGCAQRAARASRLGIPCGALLTKTIHAIDFEYQNKASYVIYALNFISSGYFWALVIKTIIQ